MTNNLSHICNVRFDVVILKFNKIVMRTLNCKSMFRRYVTGGLILGVAVNVLANPTGMTVQSGSATATTSGSQVTITTSQNAFLNWQSFNIGSGETTIFNQPSASSIVMNHINDINPSQIYGSLQANGIVVLMNSAGFYFGPDSFVKTGGLIVSTANCIPPQNTGGSWEFNGPPPLASIVNYGQIKVGQRGSAFLIADKVENYGDIEAPEGTVGLAAGQTVLLSDRPDGRGMSMQVTLPQGSVDNEGRLVADSGTIAMNAQVVNQNGLVQADSVRNQNGVIELIASDQLNLGANSQILARGDDSTPGSSGGNVTLQSGNTFGDSIGSQITTTGGAQGGNGGNVEISAPDILSLNSIMNASAQSGWVGGKLFLDPANIILGTSGSGAVGGDGTVTYDNNSGTDLFGDLFLNVNTAFAGFSQILLQATGNIYVGNGTVNSSGVFTFAANPATTWNLSSSTGNGSGQLTLEARGNITFGNNSQIIDPNNWAVTLQAGYNFVNNTVQSGVGNIYLNGGSGQAFNGAIQTASGNINLTAGQNILVGSGYVITTGGGGINAHALAGNIDTGSDAQGYFFETDADSLSGAYDLNDGLGGISTAAGGDVNLTAGGNVSSVLPISAGTGKIGYVYDGSLFTSTASGHNDFATAGSGAYGHQVGNVNIVAGGNVTGNYLVANGTGSIFAGVKMDASGNPIKDSSGNYVMGVSGSAGTDANKNSMALSLISGGWNVAAAQNIILQEVSNPNGDFDVSAGAAYNNYFDYSPGDYVNLSAGNSVQLGSPALPRASVNVPVIYPSILNVSAGAGGVTLGTQSSANGLILFPSPEGSLTINTTQGGSLVCGLSTSSGAPQIFNLIVSDSGSYQYKSSTSFGLKEIHAVSPVHLNNSTPIVLNISGDMDLVFLDVPEAAQINVAGNMNNSGFQGMNLSASDVTSINVTGDINNRSAFTSINLSQVSGAQAPDLSYLSQALSSSPSATALATSFYYNPTTQILTYQNISGKSLATVLQLLQNLTIQVYKDGVPQWVDAYDTIPLTATVSVLNSATAQALLNEYNTLGGIPSGGGNGYTIGGGGTFDISARNMDLGTTVGIQSKGVSLYNIGSSYPLASLFDQGADINVNAFGDLTMYSSSIASLNGGNINVNAGGIINVGSADFSVNALGTRGIYSTSGGDVSVIASGNVDVNGSRIATYDGGDVTVESLNGSVDAGNGISFPVTVSGYYVDPNTHIVYNFTPQIPFNGILALTFPKRDASYPAPNATLGNILVEAPNGDDSANASGILQVALNGLTYPNATTMVLAGHKFRDYAGNPLTAAALDVAQISPQVFQASLEAAQKQDKPRTVVIGNNRFQVSKAIWSDLITFLGISPNKKQVIKIDGFANEADFLAALQNNSGVSIVQGSLAAAAVNDLPQTVIVGDQRLPVSDTTWSTLVALLGISPNINQDIKIDVSSDQADFVAALQGNDANFAKYDYITFTSPGKDINANGSGIIASNARLDASGDINGLIFARNNIDITAQQNVNVTALGVGNVTVNSGGTISGTIIGVGGVSASGSSIDASLISANVTGATSGQSGLGQGTAANSTSQSMQSDDSTKVAASSDDEDTDDQKKKKQIALAQRVGRVTVILPPKSKS
jgi:filamentous hemagglutinin family protein